MKNTKMSIALFHELLNSEQDNNELLSALRSLTKIENPQKLALKNGPLGTWSGWPY